MTPSCFAWSLTMAALLAAAVAQGDGTPPAHSPSGQQPTSAAAGVQSPRPTAGARTSRPYEAPIFGSKPEVPSLPPEYLKHDQGGVRFACHPSARERMRVLVEDADEVRETLSTRLGVAVLQSVDVRVAVGSSDLSRIVPKGAPLGTGVVALSESDMLILGLPRDPMPTSDVQAAFRRGMAYLALDEVSDRRGLPRWYRVGFAIHFSGQASISRAQSLWWASMQQRLVPLGDLDWHLHGKAAHSSLAAAEAADFVRFLGMGDRRDGLPRVVAAVRDGQPFEQAISDAYQQDITALEAAWRQDVAKHKAFVPILLGGTLIWIALAVGIRLRRRVRANKDAPQPAPRAKPADKPDKAPRVKRSKRARLPTTELPEPDVPKVSHNGRWHTLH